MTEDRKSAALAGLMCPHCKVDLVMSERQSIEIDYCPRCRGVWLDRGELDKIIERSMAPGAAANAEGRGGYQPGYKESYYGKPHHGGSHHGGSHHGGRRRKSWLHELFD